jgi:hypothetical protein
MHEIKIQGPFICGYRVYRVWLGNAYSDYIKSVCFSFEEVADFRAQIKFTCMHEIKTKTRGIT